MIFFSSSSTQHINNWVCLLGTINMLGFSSQKVKSFRNCKSHSHEPMHGNAADFTLGNQDRHCNSAQTIPKKPPLLPFLPKQEGF